MSTTASSRTGTNLTRRTMLKASCAAGAGVVATQLGQAQAQPAPTPAGHAVFQHGVASGDPYPRSVILWTRATTTPNDAPGAGAGVATPLAWQLSRDPEFRHIVASGQALAQPESDGCIKVEAQGLEPHTSYYYRFTVTGGAYAGQTSPTGRTQTAPSPGAKVDSYRIALLSCSNWEAGFFQPYRDLATRGDIDIALHVGDYIYEYPTGEYAAKGGRVIRQHHPLHEIVTLSDYRARYGQYRTDPDLQAAHAACPWVVTWDDHEIANDAWDTGAENHDPATEGDYLSRRDAAMQAYLEWLPIRALPFANGGRIYRTLGFGELFELNMLDLRSYRSEYVEKAAADNPDRTMLGSEQYSWLAGKLTSGNTTWQLVGNSVMISPILLPPLDPAIARGITELTGLARDGYPYTTDTWDGFTAERWRLLNLLKSNNINNVCFLTGDIHTSWAGELPLVPARYTPGDYAAVEFVGPSITSANIDEMYNLPDNSPLAAAAAMALTGVNRHLKYCDLDHHGYCVLEIAPEYIHCDWLFTHNKDIPDSSMYVAKSMRTTKGHGIFPVNFALDPAGHSPA
ncbi:alkaline phosphatase D family protein [Corynebacterium aquilae]|uniref:Alkaline phosphatase n=1 Tax=Corynebacterium aquilae DSM 44791 TaxID=1431546 RepID=A0A1L7CIQ0_9CORY|nr:alkaline phosphatase D family protein [Corynebacterium aquilae]APT85688.1 alkaline phosphatase [Corynebacterium aquilae DSM 44791]